MKKFRRTALLGFATFAMLALTAGMPAVASAAPSGGWPTDTHCCSQENDNHGVCDDWDDWDGWGWHNDGGILGLGIGIGIGI